MKKSFSLVIIENEKLIYLLRLEILLLYLTQILKKDKIYLLF